MDERAQRRAVESLLRMPDRIGILGHRTVVPVMATLRAARPANLLTAEALAVALVGRLVPSQRPTEAHRSLAGQPSRSST